MATSISFTIAGVKSCQCKCLYCSAASTMNYEQFKCNPNIQPSMEAEFDWDAVRNTFANHRAIIAEVANAVFNKRRPSIHIDLWGGNPLYHLKAFKDTVTFLEDYFKHGNNPWHLNWQLDLHTSDNGLTFASTPVCEFIMEHNIHVQLSHDGIGQWIRTGDFDPLAPGSKCHDNIKAMMKLGYIDWINCTLSAYNTSFFQNIEYFNKVRQEMGCWDKPLYIKLNHIYDSTYDIKAINKKGLKNGKVHPELIGKPLGNMSLRGRDLADYFSEFIQLAIMMKNPYYSHGSFYKPYAEYILNQAYERFRVIPDHDTMTGACRAFQRYKHKIGDPKGWIDQTFVIDSMGRYSECNLIDGSFDTHNPGGVQPEHCKGCRYEFTAECNSCGTEKMADDCEYLYWLNSIQRAFAKATPKATPTTNVIKKRGV